MQKAIPAPMYRNQSMPVRILDLTRFQLRRSDTHEIDADGVFNRVNAAAIEMNADDIDRITSLAYIVLAIRQERAALLNKSWPEDKHQARAALAVASTMAEMYEAGSIVNVRV